MEPESAEAEIQRCITGLVARDIAVTGLDMTQDSTPLPRTLDEGDSGPRSLAEHAHNRREPHRLEDERIARAQREASVDALLPYGMLEAHPGRSSRRWSLS